MTGEATLFVNFTQEGFHQWPDAPEERTYLRSKHRHTFHVRVELSGPVDGARSIEFHDLIQHSKAVMRDIGIRGTMFDFGTWSCEQIAYAMAQRLGTAYHTLVGVTVSEDGECGATVYFDIEQDPDFLKVRAALVR